jgi:hypothetical protein
LRTKIPKSVRLACVRHAASVRSEPGSNSQVHPWSINRSTSQGPPKRSHETHERPAPRAAARASLPSFSTLSISHPQDHRLKGGGAYRPSPNPRQYIIRWPVLPRPIKRQNAIGTIVQDDSVFGFCDKQPALYEEAECCARHASPARIAPVTPLTKRTKRSSAQGARNRQVRRCDEAGSGVGVRYGSQFP